MIIKALLINNKLYLVKKTIIIYYLINLNEKIKLCLQESNKILCAILSAILLLLLSSFIGELIYHPKESKGKVSYSVEEDISEEIVDSQEDVVADISSETIEDLILNASLEAGEKFVIKNCSACHSFQLPEKNKVGPSLAKVMNRKIGSLEDYKYSKALQEIDKNLDL